MKRITFDTLAESDAFVAALPAEVRELCQGDQSDGKINLLYPEKVAPEIKIAASPERQLARAKEEARAAVVAYADGCGRALTGDYPPSEREGWPIKEAAARALLSGTAASHETALLQAEASITGESLNALAERVVAKADAFRVAVGQIAGLRRAAVEAIDAVSDVATIQAVLAGAKAQADAMLDAISGE